MTPHFRIIDSKEKGSAMHCAPLRGDGVADFPPKTGDRLSGGIRLRGLLAAALGRDCGFKITSLGDYKVGVCREIDLRFDTPHADALDSAFSTLLGGQPAFDGLRHSRQAGDELAAEGLRSKMHFSR